MSGTSFSNLQPYLAVNQFLELVGTYPASVDGDTIGVIYDFAGNVLPGDAMRLDGQTLSVSQDQALFSIVTNTFGGNGINAFDLPDLQGVATIGAGNGYTVGALTGTSTVTLTPAELPPPLPGAASASFSNLQPSLAVTPIICLSGNYPATSGFAQATFIGEIVNFVGTTIPTGWAAANGQLLSIAQNSALYSVIFTTYGGNGTSTFALPNLTGTVAVGADSNGPLGAAYGQQSTTLTDANMPPGIIIGAGSSGQPVNNDQPSLPVSYLVCTGAGVYPTSDTALNPTIPALGEIVEFAGSVPPVGWSFADGQMLSIRLNAALFSILGTTYGGNGINTFALPDLNGRTLVGTGTGYSLGQEGGTDSTTLATDNLPAEDQTPVPCFLPGTQIMTPDGERSVETLTPGDRVLTLSGVARPIVWIGTGTTRATRGRRTAATPIVVCKCAFAPNVPNRDLRVTKGHSFHLDGVLIPAEFLVNHRSVLWDDRAQDVTVFHIELETHDILLANGAAAESYRDDGNRWLFANRNTSWDRPAAPPCAPVLTGGAIVDAVWRRILDRAGPRPGLPLTDDPDLHIAVDGNRLDPVERARAFVRFILPATARDIRLVSRAAVPQELGIARDARMLGVAVRQFAVWQGRHVRVFSTEDTIFADGFHPFESETSARWTDGQASLPSSMLEGFDGHVELVIARTGRTHYIADAAT